MMKHVKLRATAALIFPLAMMGTGYLTGALARDDAFGLRSGTALRSPAALAPALRFEERAGAFEGVRAMEPEEFGGFSRRMVGFVAVCDLDNDGYEDLVYIGNVPDKLGVLRLFRNASGKRFADETAKRGLAGLQKQSITVAGCVDLDNDGWADLVAAGIGEPARLFRNRRGIFEPAGTIDTFDETRAINFLDVNNDGFLDVYFGNYRPLMRGQHKLVDGYYGGNFGVNMVRNEAGGVDRIFVNEGGKFRFTQLAQEKLPEHGITWAVGVSDFNADGHSDLFLAQDFGTDQIFFSDGKGGFRDGTATSLGPLRSRNSMSAATADVNGDGVMDVYVTNRPKAGLPLGLNSLWVSRPGQPGRFDDKARALGVDSCGWSWGAEFADLNQDGHLDLLVANGQYGVQQPTGYWYVFGAVAGIPAFLKRLRPVMGEFRPEGSLATAQEKCLFLGGPDGSYHESARAAGFADLRVARAVVALDFDRDGDQDIVTGNIYEGPVLFENKLEKKGGWLAVRLKGRRTNATGIGSRLTLKTDKRELVREVRPHNGLQSQGSAEMFFTLPEGERAEELRVLWPGGAVTSRKVALGARLQVEEP